MTDRNPASNRGASRASHAPPPWREQAVALLVAILCAMSFLREAVTPSRALLPYPPEMLQPQRDAALAAGTPESAIARGNLSMGDKYNQSLAWDRITRDALRRGEVRTWTRDIAGGSPFVPQMGQFYHPINLLLLCVPASGVYGIWYLLHMVLFGFFAYRFLRRIDVRHGAAVFGMVALILGLWTQARVHHNVMLSAVLPVFAMLSCTHHLFRCGGGARWVGLLALGTGLSWLSGFAPGSLMTTYLVCAFAVVLAATGPRGARFKPLLRFGCGIALGLTFAAVNLVPILLAAEETSRQPATVELLAAKSLELPHLATIAWPTLFCWPAEHFYPGFRVHNAWPALALLDRELYGASFNYPETAYYAGLAPLVFACCSLRRGLSWFFAGAVVFGLLMALGVLLPVSKYLPGAHSGDVKRFLLLVGVGMPVLAAIGLDRVLRCGRRGLPLALAALLGSASALLFALHLVDIQGFYGSLAERRLKLDEGTFAQWVAGYSGEHAVNQRHLLSLFGVAFGACSGVAVALWHRGRLTVPLLCAVTIAELVWHGHGTIVAVPRERIELPPPILRPVLASARPNGVRPRLQRLLPAGDADPFHFPAWPNLPAYWGIEDLAAYSPLPKRRMEELFLALEPDAEGKVSVALGGTGVGALRSVDSLTHPLADLLGIEWVLAADSLAGPGLEDRTPSGSRFHLYRRAAMPRATFVTRMEVIQDRATRLARLAARDHDPRAVVILERADAPAPGGGNGTARVTITEHADQHVRIAVDNDTAGYLRLADPYDAGWTATVDGTSTNVFVADHYFRAVFLPAGEHSIEFRYNGARIFAPQAVSLATLVFIAFLLLRAPRRPGTNEH